MFCLWGSSRYELYIVYLHMLLLVAVFICLCFRVDIWNCMVPLNFLMLDTCSFALSYVSPYAILMLGITYSLTLEWITVKLVETTTSPANPKWKTPEILLSQHQSGHCRYSPSNGWFLGSNPCVVKMSSFSNRTFLGKNQSTTLGWISVKSATLTQPRNHEIKV